MNKTVLIVEDDPAMLMGLRDNYADRGYKVETASEGHIGLQKALELDPQLIILDVMLPRLSGFEICKTLREKGRKTPIIILTAKVEESDLLLGLNLGADDYLRKPFSIQELMARSEALLRRTTAIEESRDVEFYAFQDFTLDLDAHELRKAGEEIALSPREFGILHCLVQNAGRALNRDQIMDFVWGDEVIVTARTVDRFVNSLRKKIEAVPNDPKYVVTVREVGYKFDRDHLK